MKAKKHNFRLWRKEDKFIAAVKSKQGGSIKLISKDKAMINRLYELIPKRRKKKRLF